jgi:malate dehydrogenase (oxaloacetate-decarboxylating)
MTIGERSLEKHFEWKGKLRVESNVKLDTRDQLSLAYTPGVAHTCLHIQKHPETSFDLTRRWNTVAVITDGTAVLGLGDIGPEASMPVMEGKCILFKRFADIDAIPLCLRTKDTDKIVETIALLAGSFGGVNLEDISAPRCFEIERRLREVCDIPVFHDDQHGTAVVTVAALLNALRLTGRNIGDVHAVINGAGAAATAVANLLMDLGLRDVVLCDSRGAIFKGREGLNPEKTAMAQKTNPAGRRGALADVLRGAHVFIGLSAPGCLTPEMMRTMAPDPIVFAMSNPVPEIMPDLAKEAGAAVVGTGRSDFPNQVNNVLAFPGIFRGALDVRAHDVTAGMKLAAAQAIAALVGDALCPDLVIPDVLDSRVVPAVAQAVAEAARQSGVARI